MNKRYMDFNKTDNPCGLTDFSNIGIPHVGHPSGLLHVRNGGRSFTVTRELSTVWVADDASRFIIQMGEYYGPNVDFPVNICETFRTRVDEYGEIALTPEIFYIPDRTAAKRKALVGRALTAVSITGGRCPDIRGFPERPGALLWTYDIPKILFENWMSQQAKFQPDEEDIGKLWDGLLWQNINTGRSSLLTESNEET